MALLDAVPGSINSSDPPAGLREMGKLLYFDAFNGAAGDMILGALIDLGLPVETLRAELDKLELEPFRLSVQRVRRRGIEGIDLKVLPQAEDARGGHGRGLRQILSMIDASGLDPWVKEKARRVFERLGEAEAKVHGVPIEKVHFHEVGAVDSIVDVVGACIGFRYFEVERFYSSPLALGGGTVQFSHGSWPAPAPATTELIRGFPAHLGPVAAELTTPTGAALVTTLADGGAAFPVCRFEGSGFGAGDREFQEIPNMLRLMLATAGRSDAEELSRTEEEIVVLEAGIDNMDGELLGHFQDLALSQGALDVYYCGLHMKKGRPGVLLSLLCRREDRDRMAELIFKETTTLGIRWSPWKRWALDRETIDVESRFGPVRVKVARFRGRVVNAWPEFEDLRRISLQRDVPLKLLRSEIERELESLDYE